MTRTHSPCALILFSQNGWPSRFPAVYILRPIPLVTYDLLAIEFFASLRPYGWRGASSFFRTVCYWRLHKLRHGMPETPLLFHPPKALML